MTMAISMEQLEREFMLALTRVQVAFDRLDAAVEPITDVTITRPDTGAQPKEPREDH